MSAVAGPRTLDGRGKPCRARHISKGDHVFLPIALVEIRRQEPAGLVLEEGVDADDVASPQMILDDLIPNRDERLIGALSAPDPRLLADPLYPLIEARRGVPFLTLSRIL